MEKEDELPVEGRLVRILENLGFDRARFTARLPSESSGNQENSAGEVQP